MSFNFTNMQGGQQQAIITTATETNSTSTYINSETLAPTDRAAQATGFSPLAPPFQGRGGDLLTNILEPRPVEPVSSSADTSFANFHISENDSLFGENHSNQNFFSGNNSADSVSSSGIQWGDSGMSSGGVSSTRSGEMGDTFDFLVKSLASANNYVSMLTREQLWVLRCIRPSVLYEFLQEVAKVRSDKRTRRALPNECAFCKNNGENEECYSSHSLKDWRGRVLCPVLRAFRCPRCGATGDRAHTIKYCPEASEGSDRQGLALRRRSQAQPPLMMGQAMGARAPQTPQPPASPATGMAKPAWWASYGIN